MMHLMSVDHQYSSNKTENPKWPNLSDPTERTTGVVSAL